MNTLTLFALPVAIALAFGALAMVADRCQPDSRGIYIGGMLVGGCPQQGR